MIFLVGFTIYFIAFLLKSGAKVLDYFDSASVLKDYFVILSILPALFLFLFAHLDCKKITDISFAGYFLLSGCTTYDLKGLLSDCKLNNVSPLFSGPPTSFPPSQSPLLEGFAWGKRAPFLRLQFVEQSLFPPRER